MSRRLRYAIVAIGLLSVPTYASAQEQAPSAVASRVRDRAPQRESAGGAWTVEQCMAGITYGAPLKLAASYGGGFLYESNDGPDYCALGVAKLGLGGAQASVGIGTSFAPWGTGLMATGNVVRTFGSPLDATPKRTYVGASVHFWPALALGGELGLLWRVGDKDGEATAGHRVVTWSVGFGF